MQREHEAQFDAYRLLGHALAKRVLDELQQNAICRAVLDLAVVAAAPGAASGLQEQAAG